MLLFSSRRSAQVSYTRKPDGEIEVYINPKKQLSIKNTIKKLHAPIAGRRGTNKTQVLDRETLGTDTPLLQTKTGPLPA